jgi:hypothetical protein
MRTEARKRLIFLATQMQIGEVRLNVARAVMDLALQRRAASLKGDITFRQSIQDMIAATEAARDVIGGDDGIDELIAEGKAFLHRRYGGQG